MLIDGSALLAEVGASPEDLAKAIRADIKEKTGCCASVGMGNLCVPSSYCKIDQGGRRVLQSLTNLVCSGSNILLARLATRKAKPDGQYFLRSEEVDDFIRDLLVTSLPGRSTAPPSGQAADVDSV